jgi:DNA-binding response OmpR family regulator
MRILIVEDEKELSKNIKEILEKEHYEVLQAYDGEKALDILYAEHIDLLLLDIMMPIMNGIELISTLRASNNNIPTLMLTASNMIDDRVNGLDAGADDYLCKPFSNLELLARIRSLLRRHTSQKSAIIKYKGIVLNLSKHSITKDGMVLDLSDKQFKIVELFFHNIGTVLTRLQISEYIWGSMNIERSANAIDAHIKNIRKLLGADVIQTIRAVGYVIKKV